MLQIIINAMMILHDCLIVYSLLLRYLRVHHCTHTGFSCGQILEMIHLLPKLGVVRESLLGSVAHPEPVEWSRSKP